MSVEAIRNNAQPPPPVAERIEFEAAIVFSGGLSIGDGIVYINPANASVQAENRSGQLQKLQWWITASDSDIALYSSEAGNSSENAENAIYAENVETALALLRENGENGEYILRFRVQDETGAVHRVVNNFYIYDGK